MKKVALLALACASLFGASQVNAQEVTYVEDCSQGLLINPMRSNWFITAQGGANVLFTNHDTEAKFGQRIGASADIYIGKWFTPVWGFRFGVSGAINRGATTPDGYFRDPHFGPISQHDGMTWYPERFATLGPKIELMFSVTNWLCGYNPNRLYNGVVHLGGGGYWTFEHRADDHAWHNAHNRTLYGSLGYTNNFNISKHFDIFLDLEATVMDYDTNEDANRGKAGQNMSCSLAAQVGITYKFNKTDWNCPTTAICPTWKYTDAEGDALAARLANADNKIRDLQRQLDDCLNRPNKDCECANALATVYYPINVSTLSSREKTLVESMAQTMKANPDKKYILTGWADNYTGNDAINNRLRNERVDGVYNCLVNAGVPASQLEKRIDANNLTDFGIKGAQFDRAVTVIEAK
ncbi:MAG: hypothetical protein NC217_02520 [Muribaculaceae bacterium]|nr:hypothetical protein [Muribaculaceae bacterium]